MTCLQNLNKLHTTLRFKQPKVDYCYPTNR